MTSDRPERRDAEDWLIWDSRGGVDGQMLWWRPGGRGYTTAIADAGRYTRGDAKSQQRCRPTDVAVPLSLVLSHIVGVVPMSLTLTAAIRADRAAHAPDTEGE